MSDQTQFSLYQIKSNKGFDDFEKEMDNVHQHLSTVDGQVAEINNDRTDIHNELDGIQSHLGTVDSQVTGINTHLTALDTHDALLDLYMSLLDDFGDYDIAYEYDANGFLSKETVTDRSTPVKTLRVSTYVHNSDGTRTSESITRSGLTVTKTFTYDANGRLTKETIRKI